MEAALMPAPPRSNGAAAAAAARTSCWTSRVRSSPVRSSSEAACLRKGWLHAARGRTGEAQMAPTARWLTPRVVTAKEGGGLRHLLSQTPRRSWTREAGHLARLASHAAF